MAATAAEVVKKWGGTYPGGWDATSVGNVCTQVTAEIAGRASPSSWPTGTNADEFANELAFRKCNYGTWASGMMDSPAPPVWDNDMEMWFQALLTDTTVDAVGYVKQQ
jgi:hypothetical protein